MGITAGEPHKDAAEPQEWHMGQDESDIVEDDTNTSIPPRAVDSVVGITWRHQGEQSRTLISNLNELQLQGG